MLAEQGLGDMIWCARHLAALRDQGAHVVLQCGIELIELLRPLRGVDEIIRLTDPTPYADVYIEMCSLPGVFAPSLSAVTGCRRARRRPSLSGSPRPPPSGRG